MGKVIKRRVVKISLAILVLTVILVGLSAFLSWDPERLRGFEFLGSPDLVVSKRTDTGRSVTKTTRYYYCFEADFNDVCAKAHSGLSAMDIVTRQKITEQPRMSRYVLMGKGPGEWITVKILDGRKLSTYSGPDSAENSSATGEKYDRKKGWVSVTVTRTRLRSWPPWYLLYHLKVRLGTAPVPPYPGE